MVTNPLLSMNTTSPRCRTIERPSRKIQATWARKASASLPETRRPLQRTIVTRPTSRVSSSSLKGSPFGRQPQSRSRRWLARLQGPSAHVKEIRRFRSPTEVSATRCEFQQTLFRCGGDLLPDAVFCMGTIIAAQMPLAPGTRLSQYEILTPLGAGSMGEVYRARDTRLERDVAIKVLPELVSSEPDRLQRFEVEAKAAAALNHPNILAVFQMGTYAGVPYLVSELLEGKTLAESVRRRPLPLRLTINYGVQIAHGLAAAHEKGIVHRDLKPDNLFVTKDERIKILDFGLAKVVLPRESPTHDTPTLTMP